MTALSIQPAYPIFTDTDGTPLDNGYIWLGAANLPPQTNPVVAYWDAALTIPAAQPVRTVNGYPSNSGTPGRLYVNGDYSILVQSKNGSQVYLALTPTEALDINAVEVVYTPAGIGATARTVQAKLRDVVSVKDFGAVGDGVTDDSPALYAAINAAIQDNFTLDLGSGVYLIGTPGLTKTDLNFFLNNGQSCRIIGNNATIKDRVGLTNAIGSFNRTLAFTVNSGQVAGDIYIEGLVIDKVGSTVSVTPGAFTYQQAHCIALQGTGTSAKYRSITIKDVICKDKVGGGIVFGSGAADAAYVENCHAVDFAYLGGERGDFEFQMTVDDGVMVGCTGRYIQLEPNVTVPNASIAAPSLTCIGCSINLWDMIGFDAALQAQRFKLIGCRNSSDGDFWFRLCLFDVENCNLRSNGTTDWRSVIGTINNSTITIGVNTTANTFNSLNISSVSPFVDVNVQFNGCSFIADSTANASTAGFAINNSGAVLAADIAKFRVGFQDCAFSSAFQQTANCYRNGQWEFVRCKLVSRASSYAFEAGATTTQVGNLLIDDCDLTGINGSLIRVAASSSAWVLLFRGNMDYSKFTLLNRPASEYQAYAVHDGIWLSNARPAAAGLQGQRVRLRSATAGQAGEWVCQTGSITTATWVMSAQSGTTRAVTGSRPTPNANDIGLLYLDTTLDADGKPIWWNGTAWVDATGLVV